jgi:hypothetical protein
MEKAGYNVEGVPSHDLIAKMLREERYILGFMHAFSLILMLLKIQSVLW